MALNFRVSFSLSPSPVCVTSVVVMVRRILDSQTVSSVGLKLEMKLLSVRYGSRRDPSTRSLRLSSLVKCYLYWGNRPLSPNTADAVMQHDACQGRGDRTGTTFVLATQFGPLNRPKRKRSYEWAKCLSEVSCEMWRGSHSGKGRLHRVTVQSHQHRKTLRYNALRVATTSYLSCTHAAGTVGQRRSRIRRGGGVQFKNCCAGATEALHIAAQLVLTFAEAVFPYYAPGSGWTRVPNLL